MDLRFHWSLSAVDKHLKGAKARAEVSGIPDMAAHVAFCRQAEACGIESLLTAIGFHRPDPIALAAALGMVTERVTFMVACRSGLLSPTLFAQQVNTLSVLTNGRVSINMVAGHTPGEQRGYGDFLDHDERYARTEEFLTICQAFWEQDTPVEFEGRYFRISGGRLNTPFVSDRRAAPEIYLGGKSDAAMALAAKFATCLLTLADTPARIERRAAELARSGTELGLLVSLRARPTREEALADCDSMLAGLGGRPRKVHREFAAKSDSFAFGSTLKLAEEADSPWLTRCLWTGAVPYLGAPAIALVGSYREVADAILEYQAAGVSQFLFMGWPDLEEMKRFSEGILPRLREAAGADRAPRVVQTI